MNKKYSGFTLVEMLIVMGIIIILTVVGITAGRFAINRANDVAHQNAVQQVFTSLQAFYTDYRKYPDASVCNSTNCTIKSLVSGTTCNQPLETRTDCFLVPYIDQDSFKGGSRATYYYGVGGDSDNQAVLACVTMRGDKTENFAEDKSDGMVYCAGNGFGIPMDFGGTGEIIVTGAETVKEENAGPFEKFQDLEGSTWNGETWEELTE